jgi:3-deoxy-D-manno-octulosonate 8-phosphate phosphatase (KDO 8-P phosphatase)
MTIRLLALDVDGTLTDGGVYMNGQGGEFKRFDIRDGMGIVRLKKAGVEIALISGRHSAATEQRARDLGITRLHNGVADKMPLLSAIVEELGITFAETAYMGDDVNDVECLRAAGLALVPSDGVPEARAAADYVTFSPAGRGAVREAAELILAGNGGH